MSELEKKQRDLYYLQKQRNELLTRFPEQSFGKKNVIYLILFLWACGVAFFQNWAGAFFFDHDIFYVNYELIVVILVFDTFIKFLKGKKKKKNLKAIQELTKEIRTLEQEILEIKEKNIN